MQQALFTLVLSESDGMSDSLYPFSIMHSSWELRHGGRRIFEVYRDSLPEFSIRFAGRDLQKRSFLEQEGFAMDGLSIHSAPLMILRSEIVPNAQTVTILRRMAIDGGQSFVIKDEERIIGVYLVQEAELSYVNLHAPTFEQIIEKIPFDSLPITQLHGEYYLSMGCDDACSESHFRVIWLLLQAIERSSARACICIECRPHSHREKL